MCGHLRLRIIRHLPDEHFLKQSPSEGSISINRSQSNIDIIKLIKAIITWWNKVLGPRTNPAQQKQKNKKTHTTHSLDGVRLERTTRGGIQSSGVSDGGGGLYAAPSRPPNDKCLG